MREIKYGAEAKIILDTWLGRRVVKKVRVPKRYRIKAVDRFIRESRTIHEARMIERVKNVGIPAPIIYDVDLNNFTIIMEYVKGTPLKDLISTKEFPVILKRLGELVGRMHKHNIIHGDLTPSNIIYAEDGRLVFVDFGLSEISENPKIKAIDLHVFKEALKTLVNDYERLFEEFLDGYKRECEEWMEIFEFEKKIELMGRYVTG